MKKQILSEELKRMKKLSGLMNENESLEEGRWGRGSEDPWADIETGGEYSKSRERVSASYRRQKEDDLGSTSYQSFISKIKRLGSLMTDDEAIEMMDDMKRMLSHDEIMNVYSFLNKNNISSPLYTYLDEYRGETGGYGLEENSKDVMIKEGQLGKAIARILKEEMLKEEEEEEEDYDEYDITDVDEIGGKYCKDFKVHDLKPGDIIYQRLIDSDDNEYQFARDVNNFEPYGLAAEYSEPWSLEVVKVDDDTITLK